MHPGRFVSVVLMTAALTVAGRASSAADESAPIPSGALLFDGEDDYVTMGVATGLGLAEFTLEAWIRMDGYGIFADTGFHGVKGYPILAKGFAAHTEGGAYNFNYFLAVRIGSRFVAADFESTMTGFMTGMNHPIVGAMAIDIGMWHHVAVTYDGVEWRLYRDGVLDMRTVHKVRPQSASLQHFSIGTAIDADGVSSGAFRGAIDEVRVWDHARTADEVRATINAHVTSAPGLVGSWTFDEGDGDIAHDSTGLANHGTIAGATWVEGAPMTLDLGPDDAVAACPPEGARVAAPSVELAIDVADPEASPLMVTFQVRPQMVREDAFTIAVLPDTQHYVRENWWPEHFDAMTQWLVDHHDELNLRYVSHVGDIVQGAVNLDEWAYADHSMSILDTVSGIAWGLTIGNHDQFPPMDPDGTENFNLHFPVSRFEGVAPWYGGHHGDDNDNHYVLFDGGGQSFIGFHLEFRNPAPAPEVVDWVIDVLEQHPERRAIVTLHETIMPAGAAEQAEWEDQGQMMYQALRHHPGFFLMLAGHRMGEGRRVDTYAGREIWSLVHNPQIRPEGGEGFLRLMEFAAGDDEIRVRTYSPVLDEYETDPDSEFTLGTDTPGGPWSFHDFVGPVPSGARASTTWSGLEPDRTYEWRVVVTDGTSPVTSAVRSFRTTSCPLDLTDDGAVDLADLIDLLSRWGDCETACAASCPGDADADGAVDFHDLMLLLSVWGDCPG